MHTNKGAIVVGAGIAGIAAAIRLQLKGYEVQVYEANAYAGGKLTELKAHGFRFDKGPSLFTMPQYVDELFLLAGKDPKAYFEYQKLDEICRYFYTDGLSLKASANIDEFAREIEKHSHSKAHEVLDFMKYSARIYNITHRVFLERSLHKIRSYMHWDTLKSLLRFLRIDALRTQDKANKNFFKDPRIAQLFNRYATYNGSNPYTAPATLNVIPHFEYHFGAYFPKGGMYYIVKALLQLATDLGVKFHYHKKVNAITWDQLTKQVKGIEIDKEFIPASIVVSNLDIYFTYTKLLKDLPAPKRLLQQERSSSALIFYWGMRGLEPRLGLHNIFFAQDYEQEFKTLWLEKLVAPDPTVYVHISSKQEAQDAPENCENWFVMINVPSNSGQDWPSLIAEARKNILKKLEQQLQRSIENHIVFEEVLDPRAIEAQTGSYAGALYGNSSNNKFAAFLRHANFSAKLKGLYFCGGSVHPGGGIPLALLSAKIVAELIPGPKH